MCVAATHAPEHPGMIDRPAMDEEVPCPPNLIDGYAAISLLELSGLSYRKRRCDRSLRSVNASSLGRLPRLGRKPTHMDVELTPDAAATTTPAVVVVWHLHNSTAIDAEAAPTYFPSSPMLQESMDDEGNVFSWCCAWPDASLIHTYLPLDGRKCNISLGVGLQLPGISDIQPLGIATVTIPEGIHTKSSVLMSVVVTKQNTRKFGGRIGKLKDCDYIVSPSTVLKIKLHPPMNNETTRPVSGMLVEETDTSNGTLIPMKNDRVHIADATEATSTGSDEKDTPLALLMWGSQCQEDEASACTEAGRLTLSDIKYDVSASESTTTTPSPSTSKKNPDSFVARPTHVKSDVSDPLATQPLAILMWGSQCQDEEDLGKDTQQSDGTEIDNPHSASIPPELPVSQENICLAYALMDEIVNMEQEKYHEILDVDIVEPGNEKHALALDRKRANVKRQVHVPRSTEQNSQLPDLLKVIMQKMSFCSNKVEEAIDNATCGVLFDELIGESVESSLKKTNDLWHCSLDSTKKYLAKIHDLSKSGSFASTQCSDEGSDTSLSSESTATERKTERRMALLRRGSAGRHRVECNHVRHRFIRLPLGKKQMKSGYRLNRTVSVCSV